MQIPFGHLSCKEGGYHCEYLQYIYFQIILSTSSRDFKLSYLALKGHEKEILGSE